LLPPLSTKAFFTDYIPLVINLATMEALDDWLNAQTYLEQAAETFFLASTALREAAALSSPAQKDRHIIDEMLLKMCAQNGSIEKAESQLAESRVIRDSTLEMLINHIPINMLPPKIFDRIFDLAITPTSCSITRPPNDQSITIPSVCRRWRQLALNNPSLWSHIDVDLRRYEKSRPVGWRIHYVSSGYVPNATRLWLERAKGAPLHIHIQKENYGVDATTSQIAELFRPHASSISSLKISDIITENIVQVILDLCANHTVSGFLTKLAIPDSLYINHPPLVHLTWPGNFLRELTSLQLNIHEATCPTMDQMVEMLVNSPLLRTLQLKGTFVPMSDCSSLPKVPLPCLQLLDLAGLENQSLLQLLPILSPGTLGLHIRLDTSCDPDIVAATDSFFSHSNVVSLCLLDTGKDNDIPITQYFSCLPYLRNLFLDLNVACVARLNSLTVSTEKARCPSLQRLFFAGADLDKPALDQIKNIVHSHSLLEISLARCYIVWPKGTFLRLGAIDPAGGENPERNLHAWLAQRVAKVTFGDNWKPGLRDWENFTEEFRL
jgi:hypothetical protein